MVYIIGVLEPTLMHPNFKSCSLSVAVYKKGQVLEEIWGEEEVVNGRLWSISATVLPTGIFFFKKNMCWYCQNMFVAGHRNIRTSWLKFAALQECKNNPIHIVISYCAKQNVMFRNVFFSSLNDCKERNT